MHKPGPLLLAIAIFTMLAGPAHLRAQAAGTTAPAAGQPTPAGPVSAGQSAFSAALRPKADAMLAQQRAATQRLTALRLDTVLAARSLASAEGVAASRAKLLEYERITGELEAAERAWPGVALEVARGLQVDEGFRGNLIKGIEDSIPGARARIDSVRDATANLLRHTRAVLDFVQENAAQVSLQDEQLKFSADPLLERFEALMREVQQAMEKLQAQAEQARKAAAEAAKALSAAQGGR